MSTSQPSPNDPWASATFAGAEREQLRAWSQLPLRRKLEALEELCDQARQAIASRRRRGLPYIDPFTGNVVNPKTTPAVREDPPSQPAVE